MKALALFSSSGVLSDTGFLLCLAFLNYQGVQVFQITESATEIVRQSGGRTRSYAISFNGKVFCEPMSLIKYFQDQGLCRI